MQERSDSDFVRDAQRTIEEVEIIRLSAEAQRDFVDLLLNPSEPTPVMARAEQAHRRLIRSPVNALSPGERGA